MRIRQRLLIVYSVMIGVKGDTPNIVVLFADDMGYGDTSLMHPTLETPNLDRYFLSSMRFTQWYSSFHICSPSRASMLTGRLPIRVGVSGKYTGGVFSSTAVGGLPENETTWASELRDKRNYRTMAIGKWHLGQRPQFLPTRHGFDSYFGIPYSVDMGNSAWQNRPSQPPLPLVHNETVIEQPVNLNTLSKRYVDQAERFIEEANNNNDKEQPFALYFAFSHVHVPDFVAPEFCNRTSRGRFGDALFELDWTLGKVMEATASKRNTITFFTSDNGPWLIQQLSAGSAALFFEGKTTTWEGGIRVPAAIHWPTKIMPGSISRHLVATYDVFATILSLADIDLPSDRIIDGRDLSPIFTRPQDADEIRDCIFIYKGTPNMTCPQGYSSCPGLWAVRCGQHKAHFAINYSQQSSQGSHPIVNASINFKDLSDAPLIFNIDADPSEKWPLATSSDEYSQALTTILAAKAEHEANVLPVVDQVSLGSDSSYALCCDPNATDVSNCTCNPENFDVFVCSPVYPTPTVSLEADAFELEYGYRPW